ncbi:NUDIX domain-containing protein [Methylobacterium iners]|uniref:GDP-mannose pyrophosphatase n=1 Tax=Methylobacterium iners TaxID=418707 RepID=A0ABQ4RWQ9_9HYPH|nr:NUDIX hydrolase [Methylobacterium iners]GJD93945.1 GDP-mannose pyrophosphatase NudK [Methylobacterium iners]
MADAFRFRVIHQGWNTFGIATIVERDGTFVERALEDHGRAVCVLPYDPDRRVALLVRQVRVGPMFWGEPGEVDEAPAGGVEDGDTRAAAIREAYEEAGVRLTSLEQVFDGYSMPSVSSERIALFLAPYSQGDRIGSGGGLTEEGEQMLVLEVPLADLAERFAMGTINDMKTALLVQALRLRRPGLFEPEDDAGG